MFPPTSTSRVEAAVQARCPHCGTPVEGSQDAYCCAGCELAASIIAGAGLDEYYRKRTAFAPRPEPVDDHAWNAVPVITHDDGTCEARVVIDNIRCASCVWLIERVLERAPGVTEAGVSYASGRAFVRWHPEQTSLPQLARTIARLGYRPRALGEEHSPDRSLLVRLGVAAFAAMNIMLIAVRERTREIGIRKALGATTGAIMRQFFLEGFFITIFSGAAGLGIALALCAAINTLPMPERFVGMILSPEAAALTIVSLVGIGIGAALYPARRAAALQPVEALRYEM